MSLFSEIIVKKIKSSKEFKNAGWLIGGRIAQMAISFFVGVLTARYLGPSNFGAISYAQAYIAFFTAFCNLGINAVIIKDFVDNPDDEGKAIGTTILLRAFSSFLSAIMIISIVSVLDYGENETIIITALCCISLLFQIFDTFNYWFQSRYLSKVTAIATFLAYLIMSAYKICLLIMEKSVRWFAFSTSLDYIIIAIFLIVAYKKYKGPKLEFSISKGKHLLSKSYHYILSSMMVAIYGQTDKLMLKQMLNSSEVGYYSIAIGLCTVWVFILQAVIDSMFPTILNLYERDKDEFIKKNKQLYAIIFYMSIAVSVVFTVLGGFIIRMLYGDLYAQAATPLRIATWYVAFSYLGVARNAWIVCKDRQKYLKYLYLCAAALNVFLNWMLIPVLGASGAALASLATQIATSILLPYAFNGMRENAKMMIEAILLRGVK